MKTRTIDDIDKELERLMSFQENGGGYGDPQAKEADDRKIQVLLSLRKQEIIKNKGVASSVGDSHLSAMPVSNLSIYVDVGRLNELRAIKSPKFDLAKLIQLCDELNKCYTNESYLAVAMLVRAILDHVPPIFECRSFVQFVSSYQGTKSFKKSMEHLENSSRNIADAHLHGQIRAKEVLPNKTQVNFSSDLDVLLAEIVRVLK